MRKLTDRFIIRSSQKSVFTRLAKKQPKTTLEIEVKTIADRFKAQLDHRCTARLVLDLHPHKELSIH
jgi:hypothetical protein